MNKSGRRKDEGAKGKKKLSTIPVDRLIYSATPRLVRRHVLLPPKINLSRFHCQCTVSSHHAYETGPSHRIFTRSYPCSSCFTYPPVPAATLSTWRHQQRIQISFNLLNVVPSHLESGTALPLSFPRSLPSYLRRPYSPVDTPLAASNYPATTCLTPPPSCHGRQFPAAPAPKSLQ